MSEPKKRQSAAEIRLQKDFEDMNMLSGAEIIFPDPDDITNFIVRITQSIGIWSGGKFDFQFHCPPDFPFARPIVTCLTRVWHPNIEETGAVCLNILRDNYTPCMSIVHLINGIQFLFHEPNPDSPLNKEAAREFVEDNTAFRVHVQRYMNEFCPK